MKRFLVLPIAVLAFAAACADVPTGMVPSGPVFSNEVSGPTIVVGTYAKQTGGAASVVNTHPRAGTPLGGTCVGTVWHNPQGHPTSSKFCIAPSGGTDVAVTICTFRSDATFAAQAHDFTSGNQNLNFVVTQAVGYDVNSNANPDLHVHYQENHRRTDAKGVLAFTATCGDNTEESGTLALAPFGRDSGSDSPFRTTPGADGEYIGSLDPTGAEVSVGSSTYALSGLTWAYRSRVGS
jgi:hypothetical protein